MPLTVGWELEAEEGSVTVRKNNESLLWLSRRLSVALVIGLCAASGATAQTFVSADYSGAELFQRFCSACHGSAGHGDGPVAATMAVAVPDLTRLSARRDGEFPHQEIRDIVDGRSPLVAHGTRSMPVWGYEFWVQEGADIEAEAVARELIDRLVAYLETLQDPPPRRTETR